MADVYANVATELGNAGPDAPAKLGYESNYTGLHKNDRARRYAGVYQKQLHEDASNVLLGGLGGNYAKPREPYHISIHGAVAVANRGSHVIQDMAKYGNVATVREGGTDPTDQTPVLFGYQKAHGSTQSTHIKNITTTGVEDIATGTNPSGLLASGLARRAILRVAALRVQKEANKKARAKGDVYANIFSAHSNK